MEYKNVNQKELPKLLIEKSTIILDVRETWEFQDFNIGGKNIPPHEIGDEIEFLKTFENIIVVCSNGTRSSMVARLLLKKLPESTIYHLEEGIF